MGTTYELGPFRLDPALGALTQAGVPQPLGARAVAVLAALVQRPNEYLSKAAIIDAAWPGLVVEESNLAVQISAIRRVLARAPGGERWIETLARRGYRFVGPVSEAEGASRERDAGRTNLPASATSFVGRERELVDLKRLLPVNRLLTIVGIGGIGKTRLALQAAAEVTDAYRDGTWLAELGAIMDRALVPTTMAQVLGVPQRVGTSLVSSLCGHLKGRELLLVLDNCEHLIDACAALVDAMLKAAPSVTIIATSREPLRVDGEQIYPLHPLSLPESTAGADALARSEAVELFVERARRQQPEFSVTPARAPAIAELCIHLDGIPLALELAAACVRSYSVEQINARIDDRFRLLTRGSRTALARQQTLRATFDWSYDLLAEDERKVLRRLAVFPGSFSLDAAAAVASDDAIDRDAVTGVMSQLVARSLLVVETAAEVRYRLLETTRAYAREKLDQAGESNARRRRHSLYFRDLFAPAADDWQRSADAEWCARYQPELDNVRAAVDWAFGVEGDPAIGVGLCAAAGELWHILALRREAQQRLEVAVAHAVPGTSDPDQARLWRWLGEMWLPERPPQAVAAFERALELHRRAGEAPPADLLVWLAEEQMALGRTAEAAQSLGHAFSLLEPAGPPKSWIHYFLILGALHVERGEFVEARAEYERGVALARSVRAERLMPGGLVFLADLMWQTGDLEAALTGFREAAALIRKLPFRSKSGLGLCLTNLAGVHTERNELDEALAAAREGLPLRKEIGYMWGAMDHLALRAALAGEVANAARLAGYADAVYSAKSIHREANEARACARLRTLLAEKVSPEELERLLREGASLSEDEACRRALGDGASPC